MDITLREWRKTDCKALAKYADNINIANNLRDGFPHPYTIKHAKGFINFCLFQDDNITRVIAADDEFIGSINIGKVDSKKDEYEIGYWLAQPYWGQGIMCEAVNNMCDIAFKKLGIHKISACIFAHNYQSKRVLEKAGFVFCGIERDKEKKGEEFIDCFLYAKFN